MMQTSMVEKSVVGQRIVNAPMPIQQKSIQKPASPVNQVMAPKTPTSQNQISFGSPQPTQQPTNANGPNNLSLLKSSPTNGKIIQMPQNSVQNIMNSALMMRWIFHRK